MSPFVRILECKIFKIMNVLMTRVVVIQEFL
jgi:hypothetical protein